MVIISDEYWVSVHKINTFRGWAELYSFQGDEVVEIRDVGSQLFTECGDRFLILRSVVHGWALGGGSWTPGHCMQNLYVYMFLEERIQSVHGDAKAVTYTKYLILNMGQCPLNMFT